MKFFSSLVTNFIANVPQHNLVQQGNKFRLPAPLTTYYYYSRVTRDALSFSSRLNFAGSNIRVSYLEFLVVKPETQETQNGTNTTQCCSFCLFIYLSHAIGNDIRVCRTTGHFGKRSPAQRTLIVNLNFY